MLGARSRFSSHVVQHTLHFAKLTFLGQNTYLSSVIFDMVYEKVLSVSIYKIKKYQNFKKIFDMYLNLTDS
jgi:hypothetical protein